MGILSEASLSPQFRREVPHVPFGRSLTLQAEKAPKSHLGAHRDDRFAQFRREGTQVIRLLVRYGPTAARSLPARR
jgi:hypothetical protein